MKLKIIIQWSPWDVYRFLSRNKESLEIVPRTLSKQMLIAVAGENYSSEEAKYLELEWAALLKASSAEGIQQAPWRLPKVAYIKSNTKRRVAILLTVPFLFAFNILATFTLQLSWMLIGPFYKVYQHYLNAKSLWNEPRQPAKYKRYDY